MSQQEIFPAVPIAKAAELSGLKQHMITYLGGYQDVVLDGMYGRLSGR